MNSNEDEAFKKIKGLIDKHDLKISDEEIIDFITYTSLTTKNRGKRIGESLKSVLLKLNQ